MDEAEKDRIRHLRKDGTNWTAIARLMSASVERVRRAVDPEYAMHRNARIRQRRAERERGHSENTYHRVRDTEMKQRAERMIADLPQDTRNITARLMGDPLPGRSALDRRER